MEDFMDQTCWLTNLIFLLPHRFPFNVFIMNALDHELKSFSSVGLAVQGKEICLIGDLEKLPSEFRNVKQRILFTFQHLLEKFLRLFCELCFRSFGPEIKVKKTELLHGFSERFQMPEHLDDNIKKAVEDAFRVGESEVLQACISHMLGAESLGRGADVHGLGRVY